MRPEAGPDYASGSGLGQTSEPFRNELNRWRLGSPAVQQAERYTQDLPMRECFHNFFE
jgi:hypothetical protein